MLEYAQDGTLFEYLQKGRPGDDLQEVEITSNARQSVKLKKKRLDSYRLLALAAQVANGLEHLNRFKVKSYELKVKGHQKICYLVLFSERLPNKVAFAMNYALKNKLSHVIF